MSPSVPGCQPSGARPDRAGEFGQLIAVDLHAQLLHECGLLAYDHQDAARLDGLPVVLQSRRPADGPVPMPSVSIGTGSDTYTFVRSSFLLPPSKLPDRAGGRGMQTTIDLRSYTAAVEVRG